MSELAAVGVALLFLATGLATAWFVSRIVRVASAPVVVVLVLTPLLAYLILSGRVGQLKAGDFEARFEAAAARPVPIGTQPIHATLQPVQLTERGAIAELPERLEALAPGMPVILTVTLGQSYRREDWLAYLRALLDRASVAYAALLDAHGKLVAFLPPAALGTVLDNAALGGELVRAVAHRDLDAIRAFPGVRTDALPTVVSAADALREMSARGVTTLIAVDEEGRIAGLVHRDEILARIILDVLTAAEPRVH